MIMKKKKTKKKPHHVFDDCNNNRCAPAVVSIGVLMARNRVIVQTRVGPHTHRHDAGNLCLRHARKVPQNALQGVRRVRSAVSNVLQQIRGSGGCCNLGQHKRVALDAQLATENQREKKEKGNECIESPTNSKKRDNAHTPKIDTQTTTNEI